MFALSASKKWAINKCLCAIGLLFCTKKPESKLIAFALRFCKFTSAKRFQPAKRIYDTSKTIYGAESVECEPV